MKHTTYILVLSTFFICSLSSADVNEDCADRFDCVYQDAKNLASAGSVTSAANDASYTPALFSNENTPVSENPSSPPSDSDAPLPPDDDISDKDTSESEDPSSPPSDSDAPLPPDDDISDKDTSESEDPSSPPSDSDAPLPPDDDISNENTPVSENPSSPPSDSDAPLPPDDDISNENTPVSENPSSPPSDSDAPLPPDDDISDKDTSESEDPSSPPSDSDAPLPPDDDISDKDTSESEDPSSLPSDSDAPLPPDDDISDKDTSESEDPSSPPSDSDAPLPPDDDVPDGDTSDQDPPPELTEDICEVPCLAGDCISDEDGNACECYHGFSGAACDDISIEFGRIGFKLNEANLLSLTKGNIVDHSLRSQLLNIGLDLEIDVHGRDDILLGIIPARNSSACSSQHQDRMVLGSGLTNETIGVGVYDIRLSVHNTSKHIVMATKLEVTAISHRGGVRVRHQTFEGEWDNVDGWAEMGNDCGDTGAQVSILPVNELPYPGSAGIRELHFSSRERATFVLTDIFVEYYVEPKPKEEGPRNSDSDKEDNNNDSDRSNSGSSGRPSRPTEEDEEDTSGAVSQKLSVAILLLVGLGLTFLFY
ncbi:hypothetical protein P9112_008262 [Eukaryota sp. TZLM1-RC]